MRLPILIALFALSACAGPGQQLLAHDGTTVTNAESAARISSNKKEKSREATKPEPTSAEAPARTFEPEMGPAVTPTAPGNRRVQPYRISLVRGKKVLNNLVVIEVDPKDPQRMWISKAARTQITDFLADNKNQVDKRVPERLLWYLYLVGQQYDSPIHILSGYRSKERDGSRHAHGQAVDFRLPGVDPLEIWNSLKRFDNVGLGWYPVSKFVHMDVRERSAYWIDDSGPGQRARYRKHVPQNRDKKRRTR